MTATATPPGPARRTWRTVAQCAVGIALGLPAAIGPLGLPANVAVPVAGICATFAGVTSLLMNEWDKANGRG